MGAANIIKIALIGAILAAWALIFITPETLKHAPKTPSNSPAATSTVDTEAQATTTEAASEVRESEAAAEPQPAEQTQEKAGGGQTTQQIRQTTEQSAPQQENEPPTLPFSLINDVTRGALVNIICTPKSDEYDISAITGSGVLIDERGIILTNAHIGQYFLFENHDGADLVDCIVRTGSPAKPAYIAELAYISPRWVQKNKSAISESRPRGTGEYDYAFLRIEGAAIGRGAALSNSPYPHLPPTVDDTRVDAGVSVLLAAYPASFLTGQEVQENLYIISAVTAIQEVFTFHEETRDIFSTGGSAVAQRGASGGAAVDQYGRLVGILVTSTSAAQTGDRDLRALTLAHINRSLQEELSGATLAEFLASDFAEIAGEFEEKVAPALRALLLEALNQTQ